MVSSYNIELSVRVVQVVSSSPDYSSLQPPLFVCIIISFRPAWLARALLSFKRAQSSGND